MHHQKYRAEPLEPTDELLKTGLLKAVQRLTRESSSRVDKGFQSVGDGEFAHEYALACIVRERSVDGTTIADICRKPQVLASTGLCRVFCNERAQLSANGLTLNGVLVAVRPHDVGGHTRQAD